jgi:hypothetical protein
LTVVFPSSALAVRNTLVIQVFSVGCVEPWHGIPERHSSCNLTHPVM